MARADVEVVIFDSVITAMSLPGGMVWRYGFQKARRVTTIGRALAPKRSGRMAAGIEASYEGSRRDQAIMRVSAPAPALWVHEGTQGPIMPTNGRFLRLRPGGGYGVVVTRMVDGQKANPFLADALAEVIRTL